MSINLTDELLAKTKKGKIASAKQVFLEGDQENLQQISDKTHQLEDAIKDITVSGGASTANAVSYNNETSGMTAVTAQGAIDELATKNKAQDAIIETKAEKSEVATELDKKFDKENISQEFGDSKDKVVSQFALPFREIESPEFIKAIVDTEDHFLFGIQLDGSIEWGKGIPAPIRTKLQEIITQCQQDKTDLLGSINTVNSILDKTAIKDEEGTVVETPFRYIQNEEFIFAKVDAEDKLLFGIQWDGTPVFGKTSAVEDRLQSQVTLLAEKVATIMGDEDTTNIIDTMNELKKFFAEIENTETLTSILANLDTVANNLDKTTIKDEEGNVQDTPFRVIENGEFIMSVVDSDDRILYGIYRDTGKPYYPQNDMYHISQSEEFLWVILDTANHPLLGIQQDGTCWAAKAQWLDDIKAINEALSSIDETLKTFQPKEYGKGLINLDVADSFFYISNDEYIIAVVDAENRILAGIKYDGEPYFPNHEMYSVITNEEWLYAIIDADNKVLCGFRADDGHMVVDGIDISTFIANTIIDIADIKKRTAHLSTIENDEYLSIETDADGKVIGYIAPDGSHYLYKLKSETIPEEFEHIEDPEGRTEITTDVDNKVMSYRDADGKKHEHDMEVTNLDVSNLNLQGNSVNNIKDALKANGFDVKTPVDWSDYLSNDGKSPLYIPEPRCAIINISGIDSMPTTKTTNAKAYFEMWDMQGNYFKKKVIMNAQGNSTMQYPKKSFACDFFDSDWNGDSFAIKFGDWVAQDSFHFKAQYSDFFKGISIVAYKLVQEVWASRSPIYSNPWKKALLRNINITSGSYNAEIINDLSLQKDTGAKCIPDAFPCIVYLNDEFYGVFNWALKKHRDNYHMNKSLGTNIHLDGGRGPMLSPLNWTSFEIRNPKGLLTNVATATGFESYDGDKPKELLGSDTEGYNPSDKKHVLSNKVKQSILTFNSMARELNAKTNENGGEEFLNEHYDLENLIDFYVLQYVLADEDIGANWQWITYDGVKWFICDYDKDRTFGQIYNCPGVKSAEVMLNAANSSIADYPFKYLVQYHKEEIKARYNELKSLGIFTPEHVISLVKNWFNRFPIEAIKLEYKKWAESPSNRDDNVDREHWKIKGSSYEYLSDNTYDNEKTYAIGETCAYGKSRHVIFECIKESTGNPPVTKFYDNIPYDLGYHDSIWRVTKYIQDRFTYIENEIIKL